MKCLRLGIVFCLKGLILPHLYCWYPLETCHDMCILNCAKANVLSPLVSKQFKSDAASVRWLGCPLC